MGFFDKLKKGKRQNEPEKQANPEQPPKIDYITSPGGIFMVQLLMKEKCDMPSNERFVEVLSKHLGDVEQFGDRKVLASFAAKDYISQFKDGSTPVTLMISDCDAFASEKIDDFQRSQMWSCREDRDRILSECKYQILANDTMGGGQPPQVRANMLMDYLEALMELYPQCEAVYILNSGKLVQADEIRAKKATGLERFIQYAVNVRFFNIQGTEDSIVDTIGLGLLFIEDLQYHFHGKLHDLDPNYVVGHAYSMASYLLNNNNPIKDGGTIDGIRDGALVQDIQWKCRYEESIVQPTRPVIDVCMGEYAAGNRG